MISFTVYGTPKPQGSTRAFIPKGWKRAIITTDNKKLKPWRQEISGIASMQVANRELILSNDAPRYIDLKFYFQRPKSAKNREGMIVKPDIDKLVRGVLDSLTGILFRDDSLIVSVKAEKHYGVPERVEVTLDTIPIA